MSKTETLTLTPQRSGGADWQDLTWEISGPGVPEGNYYLVEDEDGSGWSVVGRIFDDEYFHNHPITTFCFVEGAGSDIEGDPSGRGAKNALETFLACPASWFKRWYALEKAAMNGKGASGARKVDEAYEKVPRDLRDWIEAPIGTSTGGSDAPDLYEEFYED